MVNFDHFYAKIESITPRQLSRRDRSLFVLTKFWSKQKVTEYRPPDETRAKIFSLISKIFVHTKILEPVY